MKTWGNRWATLAFASLALLAPAGCSSAPSVTDAGGDAAPPVDAGFDSFVSAGHPPFPVLPRLGDAELASPRIVVIVGPSEPLADSLFAFGDAAASSAWLAAAAGDYGASGGTSAHAVGAAMPATMSFQDLRVYVHAVTVDHPELAPDGHTVYVVILQPGTLEADGCHHAWGAHDTLATTPAAGVVTDAVAYVQRCAWPPGLSELDALTSIASHEAIEAISDWYYPHGYAFAAPRHVIAGDRPPWSSPSWAFLQSGGVENGDLCEGTLLREAGFAFQRYWGIAAAAAGGDPCIPATGTPYYSAAPASDWVAIPAGTTTQVAVTGWSTGARGPWWLSVVGTAGTDYDFDVALPGGATSVQIQNGTTVLLDVTAPATPGRFTVLRLLSSEEQPVTGVTGRGGVPYPVGDGDAFHDWVFGVRTTCASCPPPAPGCGDGRCDTAGGEGCASCPDDCGACASVCGATNFASTCPSGSRCPSHSRCAAGGGCQCDMGYALRTCLGESCPTGGCAYPNFWCAPASCGASNWTVRCAGGSCPTGADCTPDGHCACGAGSVDTTCDGRPCTGGACAYPSYWCSTCGAANDIVVCSDGTTCPALSTCTAAGGCDCTPGTAAEACDGAPCDGTNCPAGGWWCVWR